MEMTGDTFFWLRGWAATGKSTKGCTGARKYYHKKCFMASSFFSKGGGHANYAGKLVGTIATQLAERSAAFKSLLVDVTSKDEMHRLQDVRRPVKRPLFNFLYSS
jgi:hypothetical protein